LQKIHSAPAGETWPEQGGWDGFAAAAVGFVVPLIERGYMLSERTIQQGKKEEFGATSKVISRVGALDLANALIRESKSYNAKICLPVLDKRSSLAEGKTQAFLRYLSPPRLQMSYVELLREG
jgi:hypothetical protein